MKFLHTSDLHIGLRLCEVSLNGEIEAALDAIRDLAVREGCDAVIVAGDIYDRAAPSAEAVALFDRFVTGLASVGVPILAVSGNHDSAERVGYLSSLLEKAGAHFSPVYDGEVHPVTLMDADGPVDFWLLPFFRPVQYRAAVPESEAVNWGDTAAEAISRMAIDRGRRNVLVAHHFAAPAGFDETAGGVGRVDPALYAPFDYTALGHLHRAHPVGRQTVRYSGSPVKCSFDEAEDSKSVALVTIGGDRRADIREIPLPVRRDVRQMRGTYEELVSPAFRARGNPDDYFRAILTDEEDIPDAVTKLRVIYPNLLRLCYDNLRTRTLGSREIAWNETGVDALTPEQVFTELWERQHGAPPDGEILRMAEDLFRAARGWEGGEDA